jgi:transketolase C-terminal domain/subunit
MRNTFIKSLIKLATKNKKIVLVVGDLGFNVVEEFKKKISR